MSFFKNILGQFFTGSTESTEPEDSKYLPEKELPVDETFPVNFKNNGGKFLYCENDEELQESFINILMENDWFEKEALTFDDEFFPMLKSNRISFENPQKPYFFLSKCESLIADDGSILFSSNQLKQLKPCELPINIVVIAKTSQLTRNKSDGLRQIKEKYKTEFPTNITTFKCFDNIVNNDFLTYGSIPKNLYLLLLEDL